MKIKVYKFKVGIGSSKTPVRIWSSYGIVHLYLYGGEEHVTLPSAW